MLYVGAKSGLRAPDPGMLSASTRRRGRPPTRAPRRCLAPYSAAAGAAPLASKSCTPCEGDGGALAFMGLCEAMDRGQAEELLLQLESWGLGEDSQGRLYLRREWRARSFLTALALCELIGEVADAEGHHPDLHLTNWNRLVAELQTHARNGLTENDFILAAKIDAIPKEDLVRGEKGRKAGG